MRTIARTSLFQLFSLGAVHAACQHENTNANRPDLDGDLFDLFRSILLQQMQGDRETELIMRFQTATGPRMAKGCFNRFVALNEVGRSGTGPLVAG